MLRRARLLLPFAHRDPSDKSAPKRARAGIRDTCGKGRYIGGAPWSRLAAAPIWTAPPPSAITPELVAEHGLTPDEYQRILEHLGREPNFIELGIFSVMWSEHCSYKSSRVQLDEAPHHGPAGDLRPRRERRRGRHRRRPGLVFKMESHNHPSYIEPYQGAATGVGGIMRDVFTMGARPDRPAQRPALRRPGPPEDPPPGRRRGRGHRRLRQLRGRAHRRRRDQLPPRLQRQHPGQRHVRRPGRRRQDLLLGRPGVGPARWSTSAPRPAATASTARPWPRPSSTRTPTRSARPCRSATPSPRSC